MYCQLFLSLFLYLHFILFYQIASAELSSALPKDILAALTENDKEERLQEENMNANLLKLTETVKFINSCGVSSTE